MRCRIGKSPKVVVGLVRMFVSVLHHHIPHLAKCGASREFCTHGRVLLWKHLCHQLEIFKYANATTVKVCRIWVSKGLRRLEFAKAQQEACGAISSAFQTGFVATVVHTMNAAVAAIKRINTPQQPQQTGLILNYPSHVACNHNENTILGARFRVRPIADALIRPPIFRGASYARRQLSVDWDNHTSR